MFTRQGTHHSVVMSLRYIRARERKRPGGHVFKEEKKKKKSTATIMIMMMMDKKIE